MTERIAISPWKEDPENQDEGNKDRKTRKVAELLGTDDNI